MKALWRDYSAALGLASSLAILSIREMLGEMKTATEQKPSRVRVWRIWRRGFS